jgi:type I restriction enzyme S subunit
MKTNYTDYIKKSDVSVLVSEAIFSFLEKTYPLKRMDAVADTTSGGTPLRGNSEFYGGEIPWLKSGELNDGYILASEEFITEKGLLNSSAKIHPEGTLLVAMYGATTGKTGIIKIKAATNQAICAVFPKDGIERDYLYWFFRSNRFKYIVQSKGGAQPNISQTVILNTKIPVPPLKIQREIIEILKKVNEDKEIDLNLIPIDFKEIVNQVFSSKNNVSQIDFELTHQLDLVKQLRQSFLREAMQGKLVPQNAEDEPASELLKRIKAEKEKLAAEKKLKKEKELAPIKLENIPFEIPESWVWCRLGEIANNIEYGTSEKAEMSAEHIPVLRMNNIQDGRIDLRNLKFVKSTIIDLPKLFLKHGDLLFNRTNSYELVGKSGVYHGEDNIMTFASYLIRVQLAKNIAVDFINAYINSSLCRNSQLEPDIIQQNGQANFNGTKLKNIICPLPPLPEQRRIVAKLDQLMQTCDTLEGSIKESRQQNERLLEEVLREAMGEGK